MGMIGDLWVKLSLKKGEFDKGLEDAKKQTSAFGNSMKAIGAAVAGVFAVDKLISFGKELFTIATQAEGIQTSFSKIGSSRNLDNLRDSVKGTVSDLELMKRAVMASNFGIPVQELGRLFQFAAKRAQDTGQSIDYLVDSIVMGIGRKSPLILDNLGISAVQLRSKLKGVGLETASVADITRAVGDIAEESFKKTGYLADNLGTKVQSLSANWANLKMTLSGLFSNSEWIKSDLDDWSKLIQIWQDKTISGWNKFLASVSQAQMDKIQAAKKLKESYEKMYADARSAGNVKPTPPKEDPIVLTAVEQLAALKKVNEELEAQRILRQEMKGEKISPLTPIGSNIGDIKLGESSLEGQGVFGNLDAHYADITAKRKAWTAEELQGWTDFTDELNQTIANGIGQAISSMAEGLGQLAAGEISGGEFGMQILSVVGKFMQQLGGLFVAYAIANSKFIAALSAGPTPLGVGLALAAGIGLIAAGSAISSFAKKGMSGGAATSAPAASGYSNYSGSNVSAIPVTGEFELRGDRLIAVMRNTNTRNGLIR